MTTPTPHEDTPADAPADIQQRFVKVLQRHPNGLVMFEFSIGWTDLSVELVLPQDAFTEFCARNAVTEIE